MADAQDLKSWDIKSRVGSSPTTGTRSAQRSISGLLQSNLVGTEVMMKVEHARAWLRNPVIWVILAGCLLSSFHAAARINVVTLPGRDSVQLTIYNSVDLTLVKETRVLTFRKGLNKLEFSWANTLIDPTSVEFRALTHATEVDVWDVSFPPRTPHTLEWRIQSEVWGVRGGKLTSNTSTSVA